MIRDPRYDRSRLLEEAARAASGRRIGRAIALYRWVLAVEPHNADVHLKVAPLLARTGQRFDAWQSYQNAARACLRHGQPERALAIYRQAASGLPREVQAWSAVARLQQRSGRPREAVETLLEGSGRLRSRRLRPRAIHLLRVAREIEPWHVEAVCGLARLLARSQQREEARVLLRGLSQRCGAARLRRVRAAQLRVAPSVTHLWLWLRAAFRSAAEPRQPRAVASAVVPLRRPLARGL
jgi:thioredoxin-like negative regulator of GroEL